MEQIYFINSGQWAARDREFRKCICGASYLQPLLFLALRSASIACFASSLFAVFLERLVFILPTPVLLFAIMI